MDSLSQVVLGGAVGYAVLGSQLGRKAVIWGAVLGTIPDLDVFLPYGGSVEAFTYHRSFSHSFLMHILMSPLIVWLILKIHKNTQQYRTRWFWLVFLTLTTHAILDSFTVYGTQLLWPLTEYPFGISNLFIIDPLYTLPLLLGFVVTLLPKVNPSAARRANSLGLWLSSLYVVWSLGAKILIDDKIEIALNAREIKTSAYMSTPAPFNTLLWRAVAVTDDGYYEIYASIFDDANQVSVVPFQSDTELLEPIQDEWAVQRLQWFTHGLYGIKQEGDKVVLSDLRMGSECSYVFNFELGRVGPEGVVAVDFNKQSQDPDFAGLGSIWQRIWDPSIRLSPETNEC